MIGGNSGAKETDNRRAMQHAHQREPVATKSLYVRIVYPRKPEYDLARQLIGNLSKVGVHSIRCTHASGRLHK